MLSRLAAGVESTRNLHATEGTVVEQPAVLPRERDALSDALVNDRAAHLSQAVGVRFARAEVATFDCVVEQPLDAVTIVAVVLRCIDAALGRDAVRTAGAVLVAEVRDLVSGLAEGRSS